MDPAALSSDLAALHARARALGVPTETSCHISAAQEGTAKLALQARCPHERTTEAHLTHFRGRGIRTACLSCHQVWWDEE